MNLFRSGADIGRVRHHNQRGAVLCQAANCFSHIPIVFLSYGASDL